MTIVEICAIICAICLVLLAFKQIVKVLIAFVAKRKTNSAAKVDSLVKSLQASGINKSADELKAFICDANGKVDFDQVRALKTAAFTASQTTTNANTNSNDNKSFTNFTH